MTVKIVKTMEKIWEGATKDTDENRIWLRGENQGKEEKDMQSWNDKIQNTQKEKSREKNDVGKIIRYH